MFRAVLREYQKIFLKGETMKNKGSNFYWERYQEKDYIDKHRNKDNSYSIAKGGYYGIKSLWEYAKNNIPNKERMPFMVYALEWTKGTLEEGISKVEEKLYIIDTNSTAITWKGRPRRPAQWTRLHNSTISKPKYKR